MSYYSSNTSSSGDSLRVQIKPRHTSTGRFRLPDTRNAKPETVVAHNDDRERKLLYGYPPPLTPEETWAPIVLKPKIIAGKYPSDESLKTAYRLSSERKTPASFGEPSGRCSAEPGRASRSEEVELRALAYADGMARQRELYRGLIGSLGREMIHVPAASVDPAYQKGRNMYYGDGWSHRTWDYGPPWVLPERRRDSSWVFQVEPSQPLTREGLQRRQQEAEDYIKHPRVMSSAEVGKLAAADDAAFRVARRETTSQRHLDHGEGAEVGRGASC